MDGDESGSEIRLNDGCSCCETSQRIAPLNPAVQLSDGITMNQILNVKTLQYKETSKDIESSAMHGWISIFVHL